MMELKYPYIWTFNDHRKGLRCRVLKRGRRNALVIKFKDGSMCIASDQAIKNQDDRPTQ